jgi:hypothetical protein
MLRDKRQYRAIIFSSPKLPNEECIPDYLPQTARGERETIESSNDDMTLSHMYYLSETEFASGPFDDESIVRKGRKQFIKWSMYYGSIRQRRRRLLFIAVPFSRMAEEVFGIIDSQTGGIGRVYCTPDLKAIVKTISSGGNHECGVTASGVRFQVTGDSEVNSLTLSGNDVLSSRTYLRATKELHGIGLIPKRLRINHASSLGKLVCECDTFGNYWFRVSAGGLSVFRLAPFISFLCENKLMSEETSFPLRKSVRDIEEAEDNAMVPK